MKNFDLAELGKIKLCDIKEEVEQWTLGNERNKSKEGRFVEWPRDIWYLRPDAT